MNKKSLIFQAVLQKIILILIAVLLAFALEGDITVSVFILIYGNVYIYVKYQEKMEDLYNE